MKLYQQLCQQIRQQIEQVVYPIGGRLPSIRNLARQHQLSIATVQRALEELEIQGLVEARPKSGHFVKAVNDDDNELDIPVMPLLPKTVTVHQRASAIFHQCDADNVINLGTSYPAANYYPLKPLQQIGRELLKRDMARIATVHFSAGVAELRKALAQRLNQRGCQLRSEDMLITNGCLEALSICLRAVARPGDTIALESPGFIGLLQLVESLGFKAIEVPCHPQTGMSLEALQLALEQWPIKAVAVVPTFSNPSGSCMPVENRKKLVSMLAKRQIPLIEDDIFADLAFDGRQYPPCKAFDKKGLVLYCGSASKTVASGFRMGWISPGGYYKEVEYFKTFTNISAPNFQQLLLAEFIKSGKYDRHLRQLQRNMAIQLSQFQKYIRQYFPPGTRLSHPVGGCVLWVALPDLADGTTARAEAIFKAAIAVGIGIIPGNLCSATGKYSNYLRINCAVSSAVDVESTIKRLAEVVALA